jgi:PAS domain S-box-containing protein
MSSPVSNHSERDPAAANRRFDDLPLKRKIYLIAAVVFAGFAVVAGLNLSSNLTTARFMERERAASDAKFLAERIRFQVLEARRHENDFLNRRDRSPVSSHQRISRGVTRDVDELRRLGGHWSDSSVLDFIAASFLTYRAEFADIVGRWTIIGLDENSGLRGAFRDAAHRAESMFAAENDVRLVNLLLTMRRHEKDFFFRVRTEYVEEFQVATHRLLQAIRRSRLSEPEKSTADDAIAAYASRFHRAAEIRLSIVESSASLNWLCAEIDANLDRIVEVNTAAFAEAEAVVEGKRRRTFAMSMVTIIGVGAIVLVLLSFIGRQIAVPIKSMSNAMIALADGNTALTIPGVGRKDEIGDMAASIEVFRENRILADELATERERLNLAEKAAAARALAESEARYRSLVELSPEAIVVHHEGRIIYANSVAARWFGAESGRDLHGMSHREIIHPEDVSRAEKLIRVAANDRSEIPNIELRVIGKNGEPLDVSISSGPITFDGRSARQLVIHDVTERKRMEAHLAQNAKLATIGELSAGILHELAQPLNIARLAAQRALRMSRNGIDDTRKLAAQIEMIESQTNRMANVIDHMRVFSRRDDAPEARVDARDAIRSVIDMVRQPFAEEKLRLDVSICDEPVVVYGRAIGLEQVVLNLLTNARDAILRAAGSPPAAESERTISVTIAPKGVQATITVEDSGGGIPEEMIDRVFDPFFTTKAAGRGTGLGLSICHTIVASMKGWLTVENTGRGAKFFVTLPRAEDCPDVADEDDSYSECA